MDLNVITTHRARQPPLDAPKVAKLAMADKDHPAILQEIRWPKLLTQMGTRFLTSQAYSETSALPRELS